MSSAAHETLSRGVLLPLMRWQSRTRPSRRPAALAYRQGKRFREGSQNWSTERKHDSGS